MPSAEFISKLHNVLPSWKLRWMFCKLHVVRPTLYKLEKFPNVLAKKKKGCYKKFRHRSSLSLSRLPLVWFKSKVLLISLYLSWMWNVWRFLKRRLKFCLAEVLRVYSLHFSYEKCAFWLWYLDAQNHNSVGPHWVFPQLAPVIHSDTSSGANLNRI